MKPQTTSSDANSLGAFLKLMLMLDEQRARSEGKSINADGGAPLPAIAAVQVMEQLNPPAPPACRPIALGPFLTMILTLAGQRVAEQGYLLRSSTVLASPGEPSSGW